MKKRFLVIFLSVFLFNNKISAYPIVSFTFLQPAIVCGELVNEEFLGAIIRGDRSEKRIALVFTGDEFGDGLLKVINTLKQENIHASFFLTGNFYRNKNFKKQIIELRDNGNYLGSHSD